MNTRYLLSRLLPFSKVPRVSTSAFRNFAPSCDQTIGSERNIPWFMKDLEQVAFDENNAVVDRIPQSDQTLPEGLPEHLITLHQHLSQSPLLAHSTLRICKPSSLQAENGNNELALAYSRPKGRRRRGVHDAGESVAEPDDMWSWYVLAQVKEGTEGRGAIEAVIRSAQQEV
jgi:hypothetical protein